MMGNDGCEKFTTVVRSMGVMGDDGQIWLLKCYHSSLQHGSQCRGWLGLPCTHCTPSYLSLSFCRSRNQLDLMIRTSLNQTNLRSLDNQLMNWSEDCTPAWNQFSNQAWIEQNFVAPGHKVLIRCKSVCSTLIRWRLVRSRQVSDQMLAGTRLALFTEESQRFWKPNSESISLMTRFLMMITLFLNWQIDHSKRWSGLTRRWSSTVLWQSWTSPTQVHWSQVNLIHHAQTTIKCFEWSKLVNWTSLAESVLRRKGWWMRVGEGGLTFKIGHNLGFLHASAKYSSYWY